MAYMYGGTILLVNLGEGKISREPTASYSGDFLGGRGINIKILYDEVPPEIAPLDPASVIIFGVGPLCGTPIPASRTEVTAKSPETGFLGSSNFGGFFAPELKYAGYDHIVITGRADKPAYLWIDNERVEIRDASDIWGKDTYETQAIIRSELGSEAKVACIGQAGENLVHFATVQHELGHGAGRTGMGAVMGSKNLKAIVVRGTKEVKLANPEKYLSIAEELHREMRIRPGAQGKRRHSISHSDEFNLLLSDPDWKPVRTDDLFSKYKPRKTGCLGCPLQCMELYPAEAKGGGVISCTFYTAPLAAVRNTDLDLGLECGLLAQKYGVDIVSSMIIIGWLMELYEKGVITDKDTDGVPMEWGSRQAMVGMLQKIVHREGFGDVLADGILPAAERVGRGSEDYAYHMKGLPLYSTYTPKRLIPVKGLALATVVSRGDVMKTYVSTEYSQVFKQLPLMYDEKTAAEQAEAIRRRLKEVTGTDKAAEPEEYEGKPELVAYIEDGIIIDDCLGACKYIGGSFGGDAPTRQKHLPLLLSAGSGVETTEGMLFRLARRVKNVERAHDVREGLTRDTDSLPKGFMDHPIDRGDFKGSVLDSGKFEEMKSQYYRLRGWDIATGIPTRKTLEQAGLKDVARDLKRRGKLPGKSGD